MEIYAKFHAFVYFSGEKICSFIISMGKIFGQVIFINYFFTELEVIQVLVLTFLYVGFQIIEDT